MPNTRVDVHLCNPVGTSFRGYRPGVASLWCGWLVLAGSEDLFPRALHQHGVACILERKHVEYAR